MSQRAKRPNRFDDGNVPVKRRKRPTAQEEEEASALGWRPINDLKIYNRTTTEAPAELFRKDLISAMKLPDSEPLASNEYWVIVDQWKQEWERGVQVPVNPDSLPEPSVTVTHCATVHIKPLQEYKPPKTRYIRITKDDRFKPEEHYLSTAPAQAEAACSYDLDECDVAWLKLLNNERLAMNLTPISEDQLERVIERYELRCWDKIQAILRNEEGLGIEYDENVICDVCRSPDSEEGNEMVFCDSCNICVHQACYGITKIPAGQWLCCTCTIKQRPDCVLCPNKGGAMKSTRSGQKWAHVSCALWIPEVSIGCVEKMEPITKISSIPQSRWALICVLCRERVGSCIQCSVKTCKTAYHVTCAFKHGLEMRAIIEDENADDGVKLRSYCEKHSKSSKKEKSNCSGSEDDDCKRKKRKDMTSEEKNQARAARQQEIEAEFFKHVNVKDIAVHIDVDTEALQCIYNYWKLKRKAGHNKPLLPPKCEDIDMLSHKQEQADLEKMKMFVQLRQDLERVRNLCYMVSRREKLSRSYFKLRESTFQKQVAVLKCSNLSQKETDAVVAANRGPSIYDRVYSNQNADETINLECLIARITGCKSPQHDSSDERKPEMNGLFKDVKNNPYKKLYFNGTSKRRSASLYGSSFSSSEDSSDDRPKPRHNKENRLHSSTDDDKPAVKKLIPVKNSKTERRRKRFSITRNALDSSSEEDVKHVKKETSNSRLKQIEKELGISASDSDELMPIKTSSPRSSPNKRAMSSIYSDSESSDSSARNDGASDSQSQSKLRTKASVKEFSHKPSTNKSPNKSSPENKKKTKEETHKKDDKKKKDYVPSDLIVPQRQAAKKATENLKTNTVARTTKEIHSNSESDAKVEEKEKEKEKEKPTPVPVTKPKKIGRPPKEPKEDTKETKKKEKSSKESNKEKDKDREKDRDRDDIFDIDKELDKTDQDILAYVPQRQAAKKAAEHIKGLGNKPGPTIENDDKKPKEEEKEKEKEKDKSTATSGTKKEKPTAAKISDKRKSSSNSSTSSSSSSSSSSSTSSSSDSESDTDRPKKQPQSESLSSAKEQTRRTGTKDWPFLDKAAKSAASSSTSDSSDSSRPPSPAAPPRTPSTQRAASKSPRRTSNKSGRKNDKKPTPPEREKPARPRGRPPGRGRPRATAHSGDRVGDAHVRHGDFSERGNTERERTNKAARKGKSTDVEATSKEVTSPVVEVSETKLRSPLREAEKKIKSPEKTPRASIKEIEPEIGDLEKEIMERKAASNKTAKSKFDRLFGALETKTKTEKSNKSPVKENKEPQPKPGTPKQSPAKKSPSKAVKSLDDIFANKLSNSMNTKSPEHHAKVLSKTPPSKQEEVDLFKIEDDKSHHTHQKYHNTHSNDELLDDIGDILEDGFGMSPKEEEMIKLPLTFNIASSIVLKEDSKEDSARETLNLVEKLRGNMGLTKKSTSIDIDDAISIASSKHDDRMDFDQSVPNTIVETSQPAEEKLEDSSSPHINQQIDITKFQAKEYKFSEPQTEDKSVPDMQHQHTDATAQADERWVPPSDCYPNLQAAPAIESKPFNDVAYKQVPFDSNSLGVPGNVAALQDNNILKSQSPITDRRVSRTPFLDAASSMDCMPSPMPYNDLHPQGKWSESNLMPNRRSSSSSVASSTSNMSRRNNEEDEIMKRHEMPSFNHPAMDELPGMLPQSMPFQLNPLDVFPQFSDPNQFVGNPVSLFPPSNASTQLPFPSPGAALFPPPFASFPTPLSVIPPLSKPNEETMHIPQTAAFTSSQHNMALTAAMVNMPTAFTPKVDEEEESPPAVATQPVAEPEPPVAVPAASPALSNSTPNHVQPSPNPSVKSNSSSGKKSPSKPTRTSARFISQQAKSPSKSPGISPRQDITKSATAGRNKDKKVGKGSSGRGAQSQSRGRGRGRGRGRPPSNSHEYDFNTNTIHNKLVGTVYDLDFDDDMSNECSDLRAMRERRKSADVHDRKAESPKFTSPTHKNRYTHLSDLRPPTPISDTQSKPATPEPQPEVVKPFPTVVPLVLPGPVDMRTYNSTVEITSYKETTTTLLTQFNSSTVSEAPVHEELDEYFEKELQNALVKQQPEEPHVPELNKIKVSLSDSRNQLKVKIKGPIANYTSSSSYTSSVVPPPPIEANTHAMQINSVAHNAINNMPTVANSGSTNFHRMRKKELLRQYCSQGMNTNDPMSAPGMSTTPVTPLNRTIITIPKAVASMTSIPTKDDYRDYRIGGDEIFETKARKDKPRPGLSRELRQLDLPPMDDENSMERRRSIGSNNGSNPIGENKRRGRPPRSQTINMGMGVGPIGMQQTTPKLKIKIGGNNIVTGNLELTASINSTKFDDKRDRIRPPKKRLSASVAKPSVEDLKRESMKFRKQVMADFSEKKEKKKKDKSNRKSKKKKKQDLQVVNAADVATTKLIIRLRKNEKGPEEVIPPAAEPEKSAKSNADVVVVSAGDEQRTEGCSDNQPAIVIEPAVTGDRTSGASVGALIAPIKLKLSRCQEGYVMKAHPKDDEKSTATTAGTTSPLTTPATLNLHEPTPPVHTATPLPLNKDCEVR